MSTVPSNQYPLSYTNPNGPRITSAWSVDTDENGNTTYRQLTEADRCELSPEATAYANMTEEERAANGYSYTENGVTYSFGATGRRLSTSDTTLVSNPTPFQMDPLRKAQIYLGIAQPTEQEIPMLDENSFFFGLGTKFAETKRQLEQAKEATQRADLNARDEMKNLAGKMVEYLEKKTGEQANRVTVELDTKNNLQIKFSGERWLIDLYSAAFQKASAEDSEFANMTGKMDTLMKSLSTNVNRFVFAEF